LSPRSLLEVVLTTLLLEIFVLEYCCCVEMGMLENIGKLFKLGGSKGESPLANGFWVNE